MNKKNKVKKGYIQKFCNFVFKKKVEDTSIEDNEQPSINTRQGVKQYVPEFEQEVHVRNQQPFSTEQEKSNQSNFPYQEESGLNQNIENYYLENSQHSLLAQQEILKQIGILKKENQSQKELYFSIAKQVELLNQRESERFQQNQQNNQNFEKLLSQNKQMMIEINTLRNELTLLKECNIPQEIDIFKDELRKFKIYGEMLRDQLNADLQQSIQRMQEQLFQKSKSENFDIQNESNKDQIEQIVSQKKQQQKVIIQEQLVDQKFQLNQIGKFSQKSNPNLSYNPLKQDSICQNGHINRYSQESNVPDSLITTLLFQCIFCSEKVSSGIQTPCFHAYHKECFEGLISNQMKNNIAYIQCECKTKLNFSLLTNFQIEDSEKIQQQLLQNQLGIIQLQVQSSGKKISKCQNCSFFIISDIQESYICKYCQN